MITLKEKIIKHLSESKKDYKNYSQFFTTLSKKTAESTEDIIVCVNQMMKEGILAEDSRKNLKLSSEMGYKKGVVSGNKRGFAFIKPLNENGRVSKSATHLFVAPPNLFGAFDGDEVLYREQEDSAEIVQILKRKNIKLVGTVMLGKDIESKNRRILDNSIYVAVDNSKFSKPIALQKKDLRFAKIGDKVEVQLIYQAEGKNTNEIPVGAITRILEKNTEIENGIISILCENDIAEGFPEDIIKSANKLVTDYKKEKESREDLTEEFIVTIDGEDAKDFDDAISISKTSEGYVLGVHIADVGEYVPIGSILDKEAFQRGTSVYFPGRVYPMLPEKISNELCSLRPNEEKLALSVEMKLDTNGKLMDYKIFQSVIKSSARLTYDQVYDVIKKSTETSLSKLNTAFPKITDRKTREAVLLMNELSKKIKTKRETEGMLNFNIPETEFELNGKEVIDVRARDVNAAHKLIEHFMILCNEVIARHFCILEIPFLYRVHEAPKNINEAVDTLNGMGFNFKQIQKPTSKHIQSILKALEDNRLSKVGDRVILKAMDKARYEDDCLGHFGLALKYYTHFTAPIRRYSDLVIHRIIKKVCNISPEKTIRAIDIKNSKINKSFENDRSLENLVHLASIQASQRELRADEAERAADDLFKAKFMENKIGKEFSGIISGLTEFGIFVELSNTVEGMIKVENLPGQNYKYNPIKLVLSSGTQRYTIGDEINIKVAGVNLSSREVEFVLCQEKKKGSIIMDEKTSELKNRISKDTKTRNICSEC